MDGGSPANVPAPSLTEFFQLDWVNAPGARPEILFLRRDKPDPASDSGRMSGSGPSTREAHVAFPGGKTEDGDEGGLYTGESLPVDCAVRGRQVTHELRRTRGLSLSSCFFCFAHPER